MKYDCSDDLNTGSSSTYSRGMFLGERPCLPHAVRARNRIVNAHPPCETTVLSFLALVPEQDGVAIPSLHGAVDPVQEALVGKLVLFAPKQALNTCTPGSSVINFRASLKI
jgi:hypothetical protein